MKIFNRISNYWLCQIGGWGLVGFSLLFYVVIFRDSERLTFDEILKMIIYVTSGIISTHLLREYIRRSGWMLLPIEKMGTRLIAAIICTSILYSLVVMVFYYIFRLSDRETSFLSKLLMNFLNLGIFIIPWVLIYYFYHYIEKSRRQQLDTLKLEALVKELELKTIKSHINPHFIFNALNSIRALIDENPGRARNAITELSTILRSSMQAEKLETVPFEKELNIVRDYLALEHIRFEDRLQVEYEVDEDTLDQPVPPMMLQTLVENAIKHGIGKEVRGGVIKIVSDFKGDFHELIVQNSGILNGQVNEEGFGLSSTKNRLKLLFGDKSNFEIKQVNGNIVEAKVLIPVITN
ncbi:MAG: histidine kinase [Chitinophagaceae bacterium]|nr:histidine kinase [Chitinophagaceae bacterium]